jgi:hypothetical protein
MSSRMAWRTTGQCWLRRRPVDSFPPCCFEPAILDAERVVLFGLGSGIYALTSAMKERRLLMRDRQSGSRNNITGRPDYGVALGAVALSGFSVNFYSPLVNREWGHDRSLGHSANSARFRRAAIFQNGIRRGQSNRQDSPYQGIQAPKTDSVTGRYGISARLCRIIPA